MINETTDDILAEIASAIRELNNDQSHRMEELYVSMKNIADLLANISHTLCDIYNNMELSR